LFHSHNRDRNLICVFFFFIIIIMAIESLLLLAFIAPGLYFLSAYQLLVIPILFLVYAFVRPWIITLYYRYHGVPYYPRGQFNFNPSWVLTHGEKMAKVEKYASIVVGPFHFMLITCPNMIKEILVTKENCFEKNHVVLTLLKRFFGNGLLLSDGQLWKSERRVLNKAFRHEKLLKMSVVIEEACNERIIEWKKRLTATDLFEVDWNREMSQLTSDVIGRCAFGQNNNQVEIGGKKVKLIDFTKKLERDAAHYGTRLSYLLFPWKFKLNLDATTRELKGRTKTLRDVGRNIIQERIRELQDDPNSLLENRDLLNLMIEAHLDGRDVEQCDQVIDYDLMIDECITFVLAGSDTTSVLLTQAFYYLTKHPEVTQRLRQELFDNLGQAFHNDPKNFIHFTDLDKLPYLNKVVKETLRIAPSVPVIIPKMVTKDVQIQSLKLKKGTKIHISPYLLQRSPLYWQNPEKFDPERKELEDSNPHYMPFTIGKRSCIGQFFALMEAKIALTKLIMNFDVECDQESMKKLESHITLHLPEGLPTRVKLFEN